jgi:O-antigen/teichoic acid export membrane protein
VARSLPRRFQRNVGSNYAMTVASIVVAVVMTPVLVHGLGKLEYGVWALVGSLVWYLPLLEFGFGAATVKYVAEWHSRGEGERVRATVATSFWLLCVAAVLSFAVGVGLAALFPILFDLSGDVEHAAQLLILLVAFDLACAMPMDTFGNVLVGFQRFDLLNATLVVVLTAQAAAWAIVLAAGGGLVALGVVTVALSLCGQASRFLLARRLSPDVRVARRFFDRALIRPLAGLSAWFSLATWSQVVIQRLDVVVVGLVVGVPEAAVYAVGQKLALLADQAVMPLSRTFFPFSSETAAWHPTRELGGSVYAGTRITLLIAAPLCIALAMLASPALDAWVGAGFDDAVLVVVFLAGATAIRALTQVSVQMLLGTGKAREPALFSGTEAVLNLVLSVVLGRAIGIEGVALATLIATAAVHLGLILPFACRNFGLPVWNFLGGLARSHGPAVVAAFALAAVLRQAELGGLVAVAAAGAAIAVVYFVVFALAGLDPGERRRVLAPVASRFGRVTEGR